MLFFKSIPILFSSAFYFQISSLRCDDRRPKHESNCCSSNSASWTKRLSQFRQFLQMSRMWVRPIIWSSRVIKTSQRHIFHQNPNGGIYTSPAPSMTVPVNQVGAANPTIITSATMQRVSQPQDHLQPSPRSTTQKVFTASAYPPITTKHSHSTKQWADATAYSCAYSNYTCRD